MLTQHADNLILGKTASPHRSSPSDELTYQWHDFRGARHPYLYISKGQYGEMVLASGGTIPADYKSGLKTVFLTYMAEYLGRPAALVIDRDKNTPGPTLRQVPGGGDLEGGGAISVESHRVIGLQVADMATYAVRRYLMRRGEIRQGNANPFDEIVAAAVASFHGRFDLLLAASPD